MTIAPYFGFAEPERNHRHHVETNLAEPLELLKRAMNDFYEGIGLLGPLPSFDMRAKRTLHALLYVRTFKGLTCAINLAVNGYYVQAVQLARHTLEDRALHVTLEFTKRAADDLWDDTWPSGMGFINALNAMKQHGVPEVTVNSMKRLYDGLSEIAHGRHRGLMAEFNRPRTMINVAPEWDSASTRDTIAAILMEIQWHLISLQGYLGWSPDHSDWLKRSAGTSEAISTWHQGMRKMLGFAGNDDSPARNQVDLET